MKKLLTFLYFILLSSYSYSGEVLFDELVQKGGVVYGVSTNTPFTGASIEYWFEDKLRDRTNYKDGKKYGISESFYINGQPMMRVNYKDGKLHGVVESFTKDGYLMLRGNYVEGKEDGIFEAYDNGTRFKIQYYLEGEIVSKRRYFKQNPDEKE